MCGDSLRSWLQNLRSALAPAGANTVSDGAHIELRRIGQASKSGKSASRPAWAGPPFFPSAQTPRPWSRPTSTTTAGSTWPRPTTPVAPPACCSAPARAGSARRATSLTVSYRTGDGTAPAGDGDYVAQTGTLTFAPGETTQTITIEVKGDNKKEANETFYLDLFALGSNSQFTKNRGIGTLLNGD